MQLLRPPLLPAFLHSLWLPGRNRPLARGPLKRALWSLHICTFISSPLPPQFAPASRGRCRPWQSCCIYLGAPQEQRAASETRPHSSSSLEPLHTAFLPSCFVTNSWGCFTRNTPLWPLLSHRLTCPLRVLSSLPRSFPET